MMDNFNIFNEQVPKNIKFILVAIAQFVVIVIIISVVSLNTQEHQPIEIEQYQTEYKIPDKKWEEVKQAIWLVAKNNIDEIDENKIDDAYIRDGSYKEEKRNRSNIDVVNAEFLVDIDKLKQTYLVKVVWPISSKNDLVAPTIDVECPPKSLMKYPETKCKGMTTTTSSPQLYLPYEKSNGTGGYDYWIEQNEKDANEIIVNIYKCGYEDKKASADQYLKSSGLELDKYRITYKEFSTELPCEQTY